MEAQQIATGIFYDWIDAIENFQGKATTKNDAMQLDEEEISTTKLMVEKLHSKYGKKYEPHSELPVPHPHRVHQVKVLKQRTYHNCGYHAYHNALYCLYALLEQDDHHLSVNHLEHTQERVSFWYTYNRMQKLLLERVEFLKQDYYPWTKEDVTCGVLEREHAEYLLKTDPLVLALGGSANFTALPDLNKRSMRQCIYSVNTINHVEAVLNKFQEHAVRPLYHVFLIGCGNHWFSFVVYKHLNQAIELIYLDSRNNRLLGKSDEVLLAQVEKRLQSSMKRKPKSDAEQKRYIKDYMASLHDCTYTIELMRDCIIHKKSFKAQCLNTSISGIIEDSYEHHVNMKDVPVELKKNLLITWLREWWPPQQLVDGIIQYLKFIGIQCADTKRKNMLQSWTDSEAQYVQSIVHQVTDTKDAYVVRKFLKTLNTMQVLANM